MQKKPRAGILFLTIMMLWGIIYPQYAFTEEMYETVQSADAADGSDKTAVAAGREIEEWFGEKDENSTG